MLPRPAPSPLAGEGGGEGERAQPAGSHPQPPRPVRPPRPLRERVGVRGSGRSPRTAGGGEGEGRSGGVAARSEVTVKRPGGCRGASSVGLPLVRRRGLLIRGRGVRFPAGPPAVCAEGRRFASTHPHPGRARCAAQAHPPALGLSFCGGCAPTPPPGTLEGATCFRGRPPRPLRERAGVRGRGRSPHRGKRLRGNPAAHPAQPPACQRSLKTLSGSSRGGVGPARFPRVRSKPSPP